MRHRPYIGLEGPGPRVKSVLCWPVVGRQPLAGLIESWGCVVFWHDCWPHEATLNWPDVIVLGIETSCDETGVALYDTGRGLLADALYSQIHIHAEYGGVIPELASRDHIRKTLPLVREVIEKAGIRDAQIGGVAYTAGPGLIGALLVGAAIGRSLAMGWNVPAIGVHHMEGHLLAPMLESDAPTFPFISLLVSGGHTQLVRVEGIGRYKLLGESLDDAAGEAFDKVGKMLGLPYPWRSGSRKTCAVR